MIAAALEVTWTTSMPVSTARDGREQTRVHPLSSAALAAPFVWPFVGRAQARRLKNRAGNFEYGTDIVAYPRSVAEVQEVVKKHLKLRVLGTRHCFNTIADSRHALVSLRDMRAVVGIDSGARTVTIEAA